MKRLSVIFIFLFAMIISGCGAGNVPADIYAVIDYIE